MNSSSRNIRSGGDSNNTFQDTFREKNYVMNAINNQIINENDSIMVKDKMRLKLSKLRNLSMKPVTISDLHKSVTIMTPEGYEARKLQAAAVKEIFDSKNNISTIQSLEKSDSRVSSAFDRRTAIKKPSSMVVVQT